MKIKIIFTALIFFATSKACFASQIEDEFAIFDSGFETKKHQIYDPFEKVNRKIFQFNDYADIYAFEPLAKNYRKFFPSTVRKSVRNFTTNISLPVSLINSSLQGKTNNSLATFSYFLINSTIGILGIFDVASSKNIKYEKEDFGQTLANYGINSGPFLVLPVFGPANLRDASGMFFDISIDYTGLNILQKGQNSSILNDDLRIVNAVVSSVDARENLIDVIDDAKKNSFDLYATMRSYYTQNRIEKIKK